jgi:hypothetical protein
MWALQSEPAVDVYVTAALSIYAYLAFRRAYHTSPTRSAISALVVAVAIDSSLTAYHWVLFYTAFWTT